MRVSYAWLKELLGDLPAVDVVVDRLTQGGLQVEGVEHAGDNLSAIRVARVVSARPHPTSKNPLTLVTVDTGSETVEVVCGAPNVPAAGGLVCYAPVGATVFDKKGQTFRIEARPVAGVVSAGMLCAEDELGLGTDHDGIVILANGTVGQSLASQLPGVEDWTLEINVTPNRPDALGHIGVARDLAALLSRPFASPTPGTPARTIPRSTSDVARVRIDDAVGCPRYTAWAVEGVRVGASPQWLRTRLHRLGVRPISNVVDVTNYVMLLFAQPLHGFDLDVLGGQQIIVRRATAGEKIQTLDGVVRDLHVDDLVIADAARPVAIAGVMGGEGSGITNGTTRVLLESAYFDPRSVRRTAKRHGMHSDASHRFERGVDPTGVPLALATAATMLADLSGGSVLDGMLDVHPAPIAPRIVPLRLARANAVLGHEVPVAEARKTLGALGFALKATSETTFDATVPGHRPDVQREIDLIEEIGRVAGFSNIPSALPPTSGARAGATRDFRLRRRVRETCAALGLSEAIHYGFVGPKDLEAARLHETPTLRITNPLSEDRSVLRPSLLPSLLRAVSLAWRHNTPRARLFEVGTTFAPEGPRDPGLAHESTRLGFVLAGPRDAYLTRSDDVDFFDAKGLVESIVEQLTNATPTFAQTRAAPPWAHPHRFAWVDVVTESGQVTVGVIGEIHPDVRSAMDLPRSVVAGDLAVSALARELRPRVARVPGRFPAIRRDVALLAREDVPAGDLERTLRQSAGADCESVELFDRYVGPELPPGHHSLAFALWFRSDRGTLTDEAVDGMLKSAVDAVVSGHGAARR